LPADQAFGHQRFLPKNRHMDVPRMDELRRRLEEARPSNWQHWPMLRNLWPWFAALGAVVMLAIPWGIRAEERSLDAASREALAEAGILIEDITFTGRRATIVADLTPQEQNAAVTVLAEMGGVAKVTWQEGSGLFVAPTTTSSTTTTTETPEPSARITVSVKDGRITLRGIVPAARAIKDVGDAAAEVWGSDVVNQLFVDESLLAHPWLATAEDAIAVLTMLIDPQLTLDAEGATITGGAIDESTLEEAITRLAAALGDETEIDNKVTVTPLDLPRIQILSPGDGTVALEGTVANTDVRKAIVRAVGKTGSGLETTNEITIGTTTADVYPLRRIPDLVATLGPADQWTLLFDGESLGGSAVGGRFFVEDRVKVSAPANALLDELGRFLHLDPHLNIEIEVHADPREGDVDATDLAVRRAEALAARLIRLGIDPHRISAVSAAGTGELLRFQLIPADH
jgi:osmotically-inducible protein OsmY